jgi:hypothetical protein
VGAEVKKGRICYDDTPKAKKKRNTRSREETSPWQLSSNWRISEPHAIGLCGAREKVHPVLDETLVVDLFFE